MTTLESLTPSTTPAGLLRATLVTKCAGCNRTIPECGYHVLGEDVFCGLCAVLSAAQILIDADLLQPLDAVELQPLDVLRRFVHEQETRNHDASI